MQRNEKKKNLCCYLIQIFTGLSIFRSSMLSLHRSAQLITTEVKSCEMGMFLSFYLGGLDRTLTWLNSYLNIFPCFSISRLEMLPLFLEPKLWEKLQGKFEKKVKVWATWSSLAASLWPMATRELTGVGQLSWRPVPIKFLTATLSLEVKKIFTSFVSQ